MNSGCLPIFENQSKTLYDLLFWKSRLICMSDDKVLGNQQQLNEMTDFRPFFFLITIQKKVCFDMQSNDILDLLRPLPQIIFVWVENNKFLGLKMKRLI